MHSVVILRALTDVKRKGMKALLCSRNCLLVASTADCVKLLSAIIISELPDFSKACKGATIYRGCLFGRKILPG